MVMSHEHRQIFAYVGIVLVCVRVIRRGGEPLDAFLPLAVGMAIGMLT